MPLSRKSEMSLCDVIKGISKLCEFKTWADSKFNA